MAFPFCFSRSPEAETRPELKGGDNYKSPNSFQKGQILDFTTKLFKEKDDTIR